MFWWVRWHQRPAGGTSERCELQSRESGAPGGEGGSGKRRGRSLALPPPHLRYLPPLDAEGGEEPCGQPVVKVGPLRSHYRPARICKLERGLERVVKKYGEDGVNAS